VYDDFFSPADSFLTALSRPRRHDSQPRDAGDDRDYIKNLRAPQAGAGMLAKIRQVSQPTKKLHLPALRNFFDCACARHAVMFNPAVSIRGPKHSANEGKTTAFHEGQIRSLLDSIDTSTPIGLRDRAIIDPLKFTAAGVDAIVKIKVRDFVSDGPKTPSAT
jgi:site-specific recombinase XerD